MPIGLQRVGEKLFFPRHTPDTPQFPPTRQTVAVRIAPTQVISIGITMGVRMNPRTELPAWCLHLITHASVIAALPKVPTTMRVLKARTGLTAQAIRAQLSLANWHLEYVWSRDTEKRRVLTTWWCPPETSAPRTPRGRPRLYMTISDATKLLNL